MAKNRFAGVETSQLELSDGDWIEAKNELTYRERLDLNNASFVGQEGARVLYDIGRYHLKRMELYIVDWSLKGKNGKDMPLTRLALEQLREEDAMEINAALDAHIQAMNEASGDPEPQEAEPPKNVRSASKSRG